MEAMFTVLVMPYVKSLLKSWSYDYSGKCFRYYEQSTFCNNALLWCKVPMEVCRASMT